MDHPLRTQSPGCSGGTEYHEHDPSCGSGLYANLAACAYPYRRHHSDYSEIPEWIYSPILIVHISSADTLGRMSFQPKIGFGEIGTLEPCLDYQPSTSLRQPFSSPPCGYSILACIQCDQPQSHLLNRSPVICCATSNFDRSASTTDSSTVSLATMSIYCTGHRWPIRWHLSSDCSLCWSE